MFWHVAEPYPEWYINPNPPEWDEDGYMHEGFK